MKTLKQQTIIDYKKLFPSPHGVFDSDLLTDLFADAASKGTFSKKEIIEAVRFVKTVAKHEAFAEIQRQKKASRDIGIIIKNAI